MQENQGVLTDRLLDFGTVAINLNISVRGLHRVIARGDLPPPVKIGKCSRLFESDLIAFKERLKSSRQNPIHSNN